MPVYTKEEVKRSTLEFFDGDELAADVMMNKYLMKNKEGEFLELNPQQMFEERIAPEFHRVEGKYPNPLSLEEIKGYFLNGGQNDGWSKTGAIMPQGSPLFGIGNNHHKVALSNCFVINSPEDSYGGILKTDEELAHLMKRRGGCGTDISTLRPAGSIVNNAALTTDGAVCFLKRYSNTTNEVAQNGRRGSLMISIDCRHPDLLDFIKVKRDHSAVTGANISIKWRNDFFEAVEKGTSYTLRFPVESTPENATVTREVDAREVWKEFVKSNHMSGDPGCMFWDTIVDKSLSDCYLELGYKTVTSNPCSELFLGFNESCLLKLINLSSIVNDPFSPNAHIDFNRFNKYVRVSTRLMDSMIDLETEKIETIIQKIQQDPEHKQTKTREIQLWQDIRDKHIEARRTGLGTTALADMIAMMNLKYDSPEALKLVEKVFSKFHEYNMDENAELAKERGPFAIWNWELEKDCHYIKILPQKVQDKIKKYGRRNISTTTCAPAGSMSIIAQTTSGMEPLFMTSYNRNRKMTQEEIKSGMKPSYVDETGIKWTTYECEHAGLKHWKKVNPDRPIEESPYYGSETNDIDWKAKVKIQSVMQKYITHSISVTYSLPEDVKPEVISEIYFAGWKAGLKGMTVYRNGSKKGVLVAKDSDTKEDCACIKNKNIHKRPKTLECDIHYSNIKNPTSKTVDNWIFMVGKKDGCPYEIFGGKRSNIEIPKKYKTGWIVKNGTNKNSVRTYELHLGSIDDPEDQLIIKDIANEFSTEIGTYTRMISLMLRHGTPINFICEQLHKEKQEANMWTFERSCARVLKKYIKDGADGGKCPECGKELIYKDGCVGCFQGCGWSKCG